MVRLCVHHVHRRCAAARRRPTLLHLHVRLCAAMLHVRRRRRRRAAMLHVRRWRSAPADHVRRRRVVSIRHWRAALHLDWHRARRRTTLHLLLLLLLLRRWRAGVVQWSTEPLRHLNCLLNEGGKKNE
jgi:hypothetical protein